MTRTPSRPLLALVALLSLLLALPAGAESLSATRQKRDAARAKRARLASELNALKASDSEMEKALAALNAQVAGDEAAAADARQAAQVAEAQYIEAEARLAKTAKQISELHDQVVTRAVASYVGSTSEQSGMSEYDVNDLNDLSRRDALLEQVGDRDRDVIDELREARQDHRDQKKAAEAAKVEAEKHRAEAEARLASARDARAEKARLAAAINARIADYEAEAQAIASQEAALSNLIRSREVAGRASRGADSFSGRISPGGLVRPVGGPITSRYGYRWGRLHAGLDFGCSIGTPIHAAKGGTVIFSGSMNGYGNVIIIDHGGGFSTLYAHQSRLGAGDGQSVSQGQVIGYSGNTGNSTGPHLHFETRVDGSPQDPERYL